MIPKILNDLSTITPYSFTRHTLNNDNYSISNSFTVNLSLAGSLTTTGEINYILNLRFISSPLLGGGTSPNCRSMCIWRSAYFWVCFRYPTSSFHRRLKDHTLCIFLLLCFVFASRVLHRYVTNHSHADAVEKMKMV